MFQKFHSAALAGFATGFFRPALYAGLPNLLPNEDLPYANSLLQTIENVAWALGPVLGGVLVAATGGCRVLDDSVTFLSCCPAAGIRPPAQAAPAVGAATGVT
jgi:MFS family permease